jgi:hypothetical protein
LSKKNGIKAEFTGFALIYLDSFFRKTEARQMKGEISCKDTFYAITLAPIEADTPLRDCVRVCGGVAANSGLRRNERNGVVVAPIRFVETCTIRLVKRKNVETQ